MGEIGRAARVFEAAQGVELVGDGNLVDGLVAVEQCEECLEAPSVAAYVEVGCLEEVGDLGDRLRVHEDGADYGLLGVGVVRQKAVYVQCGPH